MTTVRRVQILGEAPADLVEDQADQRLGAADVGGRHDKVERRRLLLPGDVGDAPVAAPRHLRHDRIAVEPEERHCGGEHAGALVVGLVEQLPRGRGDDGMRAAACRDARVVIIATSVVSIGRLGSDRNDATPASVLSVSA